MTLPEVEPLPASVSTVFAPGTCLQRAYCTVSVSPVRKPEPHRVYYEVHGSSSPEAPKLVFIMGLNSESRLFAVQESLSAASGYSGALMALRELRASAETQELC